MNRRRFLKHVSAWSVGAAVLPPVFVIDRTAVAAQTAPPKLAVAKGKDFKALVAQVLEPLGGIGAFVKKGQSVVVKPNIAWDRNPDQAANTHPVIVKSLVELALDAGASKVMVFDRPCHEKRRTYANSGIMKAVQSIDDTRASCTYIDDRKFVPVKIKKGKELKEWAFYKDALEADCYINVPIAKHHRLAKLTIGLKNIMGVLGGNRGKLHGSLGQNLADCNTVQRSHLTIVDATRVLLRHGPVGGNLKDVEKPETLIASADIVAADAFAAKEFFGMEPGDVPAIRAAAEIGLGQMDLKHVKIVKA